MGIYERRIFPWINDRLASNDVVTGLRREALAGAAGDIIEVGFGTGLNVANYPAAVRSVTAVEPNVGMLDRAHARVSASACPVRLVVGRGERLPFRESTFDAGVSTLTLCSVTDPAVALRELWRVLRPGGRLYVLEHGRSDDARVARWQQRLNPIQKVVACGCNLDRPVVDLVEGSGFEFEQLRRFYLAKAPRPLGWIALGVAVKTPIPK